MRVMKSPKYATELELVGSDGVKPAALKPVPNQWSGVSPFSSSYCGLRNAIVLPAAHFVITVKNDAQINLEGASPHPRLAEP